MEQVIVRYVVMPLTVNGVTTVDHEGDFNVYINSALSWEEQELSLLHELAHIENDDFFNGVPLNDAETAADCTEVEVSRTVIYAGTG